MGWLNFVQDNQIDYEEAGITNIEVACPFCGPSHSNHKLGLALDDSRWGCWRDSTYRGHNPVQPIKELLGCSWSQAKVLAEKYFAWNFEHEQKIKETDPKDPEFIEPPAEFREFNLPDPMKGFFTTLSNPFKTYLENRDFSPNSVISRYDLRWCVIGRYAHRLIIPVKLNKQWLCWTARDIGPAGGKRYLAASDDCPNTLTDFLFDEDSLSGGSTLVVTEGPMDVMRINSCLLAGLQATCLFGQNVQKSQLLRLIAVSKRYKRIVVSLDKDAALHSYSILSKISMYIPHAEVVVPQSKDWGEAGKQEIKELLYDPIRIIN